MNELILVLFYLLYLEDLADVVFVNIHKLGVFLLVALRLVVGQRLVVVFVDQQEVMVANHVGQFYLWLEHLLLQHQRTERTRQRLVPHYSPFSWRRHSFHYYLFHNHYYLLTIFYLLYLIHSFKSHSIYPFILWKNPSHSIPSPPLPFSINITKYIINAITIIVKPSIFNLLSKRKNTLHPANPKLHFKNPPLKDYSLVLIPRTCSHLLNSKPSKEHPFSRTKSTLRK